MKHNFDHVDINEMEELHGPLFKYSEFTVGQHITYSDEGKVYALASCNLSVDGHTEITGGFLRLVARRDLARNCTCSYCHKALSTYTEESEEAHHE